MRSDLNKQLCERERHRSWDKHHGYRHDKSFTHGIGDELENLPARESMSIRYKQAWRGKEFNENLRPLRGLIHKNVGQHWDKFYSELCKNFNMDSVINRHILEHLYGYIEVNTCEIDGEIYYRSYTSSLSPVKDEHGPEYYVHPRSRQIILNKHYKTRNQINRGYREEHKKARLKDIHVINDFLELRKRNGIWFICELEAVPNWEHIKVFDAFGNRKAERRPGVRYDLWDRQNVEGSEFITSSYYGNRWVDKSRKYVKSVKTANHKELKKYGIIKD